MTDVTYGPRSKDNATILLAAARDLGYPTSVVKTTRRGYVVPEDVLEAALGVQGIQEGVTYPAPDESAPEAQEKAPTADEKPRGNASREAWADYAKSRGVQITDDLSRDDIKNMVEE